MPVLGAPPLQPANSGAVADEAANLRPSAANKSPDKAAGSPLIAPQEASTWAVLSAAAALEGASVGVVSIVTATTKAAAAVPGGWQQGQTHDGTAISAVVEPPLPTRDPSNIAGTPLPLPQLQRGKGIHPPHDSAQHQQHSGDDDAPIGPLLSAWEGYVAAKDELELRQQDISPLLAGEGNGAPRQQDLPALVREADGDTPTPGHELELRLQGLPSASAVAGEGDGSSGQDPEQLSPPALAEERSFGLSLVAPDTAFGDDGDGVQAAGLSSRRRLTSASAGGGCGIVDVDLSLPSSPQHYGSTSEDDDEDDFSGSEPAHVSVRRNVSGGSPMHTATLMAPAVPGGSPVSAAAATAHAPATDADASQAGEEEVDGEEEEEDDYVAANEICGALAPEVARATLLDAVSATEGAPVQGSKLEAAEQLPHSFSTTMSDAQLRTPLLQSASLPQSPATSVFRVQSSPQSPIHLPAATTASAAAATAYVRGEELPLPAATADPLEHLPPASSAPLQQQPAASAPAENLHSAAMQQKQQRLQVAENLSMAGVQQKQQVVAAGSTAPLDWGRLNRMLREAGFSNLALKSAPPGGAAGASSVGGGERNYSAVPQRGRNRARCSAGLGRAGQGSPNT